MCTGFKKDISNPFWIFLFLLLFYLVYMLSVDAIKEMCTGFKKDISNPFWIFLFLLIFYSVYMLSEDARNEYYHF